MEIHFLELPKFRNKKNKDYRESEIERWLEFLQKDITEPMLKELISLDALIGKAEEKIEYLSSDEETMRIYYERERSLHERANMINSAESRGIAQGLAQGIEQGIEQVKKQLARNLLDILDDETIAIKTGLEIDEVRKMRNEVN